MRVLITWGSRHGGTEGIARRIADAMRDTGVDVALAFTAIVAGLDAAIIAGLIQHSFAMFASIGGMWLPLALILGVTWATGAIMATLPWPKPAAPPSPPVSTHP